MQGRKYFWNNDYLDETTEIVENIYNRDILLHPKPTAIDEYQFDDKHMQNIINVIQKHIAEKNKIAICGDYDVDGITSTTILLKVLHKLGADVGYYIPNRFDDGYGINENIIDNFMDDGVDLIITVDNGIVAIDAVAYAKSLDIDIIITDHHGVGDELPDTPYILHPHLDENLKTFDICGAMVAFLLGKALLKAENVNEEHLNIELLQLACLGTIADMMPLNQTINRQISWLGFQSMLKTPLLLIDKMVKLMKIEKFTSDSISFQMVPCLNAVGRLADANEVVEAFMTTKETDCEDYLMTFIELNNERKELTTKLVAEIENDILSRVHQANGFLLAYGTNWHQGILGIVAQRIMQKFQRPVILLTTSEMDETVYTGSARAFGNYNVKECFDYASTLLLKNGGHQHAGGLSVSVDKIAEFSLKLEAYNEQIKEKYQEEELQMFLDIDGWLDFKKLNADFLNYQEQFAPFGEKNKKFNIGIKQVRVKEIAELGKTKQHVKITVTENNKNYQIVAFQMYDLLAEIAKYSLVDLVIECQKNYFNGMERIQFLLVDIRTPEKQIFDFRNLQYQTVKFEQSQDIFVIQEIPLNVTAFLENIQKTDVKKIYLQPLKFESHLLYAETIDKKYFDYIYKYVYSKENLNLQDENIYIELYHRKIPKSVFLYVIRVFFELDFVIIEENICQIAQGVKKSELQNSKTYQNMSDWLTVRNLLLTGSIDNLYTKLLRF